jgi:hypothetical protein
MADECPPHAHVMQMMMAAWTAQTIAALTRLDVPELMQEHGPLTARQLAEEHGVDAKPEFLQRALRAGAGAGIFTEDAAGRFGPTALSEVLTLGSPASVKRFVELIGGRWWGLFGALPDALRTGRHVTAAEPGAPSVPADPAHRRRFGEAMKSRVDSTRGVLERCDFSRARTLVDVGGGFGHLAVAILRRHPHVRTVVLDLPDVIALAEEEAAGEDAAVRERLRFVGGDMFVDVPPGDTYVLRAVVHDWDDASVIRVLGHCRARLPGDGRILCVDNVLPPLGDTGCASTKLLDMLMMVSLPGKERTEAEWRALYEAAGLRLASITPINPRSGESVVEGVAR